MKPGQLRAIQEAYTTLRTIYEACKNTNGAIAFLCSESASDLEREFPSVVALQKAAPCTDAVSTGVK